MVIDTTVLLAILQDEPERRAFAEKARIELVPVDLEQLGIARRAFGRFGKGRHPAALNFGDCFSYALARSLGEPLLIKGDDFARCREWRNTRLHAWHEFRERRRGASPVSSRPA